MKLKRLDSFIGTRATGSPSNFAKKMQMCETTLFEYLSIMREMGAPIKYDKYRQTYYYESDGSFIIAFQNKITDP